MQGTLHYQYDQDVEIFYPSNEITGTAIPSNIQYGEIIRFRSGYYLELVNYRICPNAIASATLCLKSPNNRLVNIFGYANPARYRYYLCIGPSNTVFNGRVFILCDRRPTNDLIFWRNDYIQARYPSIGLDNMPTVEEIGVRGILP